MNKKDYVVEIKKGGCNCAQAVLCAYAEELQLPMEMLKKIGAAFGGGMGCMEGNCGALVGAEIVLGLAKYNGKPLGKDAAGLYRSFQEKCGSTVCKEIKGIESGQILCSCEDCIRNAVSVVEEIL